MGNEKFECSLHRCDPVEVHFRHIRKKNNVLVNYVMTYPAILVKLKKVIILTQKVKIMA